MFAFFFVLRQYKCISISISCRYCAEMEFTFSLEIRKFGKEWLFHYLINSNVSVINLMSVNRKWFTKFAKNPGIFWLSVTFLVSWCRNASFSRYLLSRWFRLASRRLNFCIKLGFSSRKKTICGLIWIKSNKICSTLKIS